MHIRINNNRNALRSALITIAALSAPALVACGDDSGGNTVEADGGGSDGGSDTGSGTDTGGGSETDTGSGTDTGGGTDSDTGNETDTGGGVDAGGDTDTGSDTDTGGGTETDAGTSPDSGTDTDAAPDTDAGPLPVDFIILQGTTVSAADTSWFADDYFPTLAGQDDVTRAESYTTLGSPFPGTLAPPTNLSIFHFDSADAPSSFLSSALVMGADGSIPVPSMADAGMMDAGMLDAGMLDAGMFDAGGMMDAGVMTGNTFRASFKLVSFTERAGATMDHQFLTVIGLSPAADIEDEVMKWEDETHVPWLMQYDGLDRVIRYELMDVELGDAAGFPKYIEMFYYPDQEAFDGWSTSAPFQDAEADRKATWTDDQLGIPWVMWNEFMSKE